MASPIQDPPTLTPAERKTEEELQKLIDERENANLKAADELTDSAQARKIAAGEAADTRAKAALDRETTKVAQEKAVLDNETVRLDNEKKAEEGRQADYDSLAAKIAAAVPRFSEIPMSTLSVPDGSALRESENVSLVLDNAVKALVAELKGCLVLKDEEAPVKEEVAPVKDGEAPAKDKGVPAFVITGNSQLARSAVAYYALKAQITGLTGQATTLEKEAIALLGPAAAESGAHAPSGESSGPETSPGVPDAGDIISAAVAAAAQAVTEVAALFQTESELSSIVSEPGEFTVHAKLTRQLLGAFPGTTIRPDEVTPVAASTELLTELHKLIDAHGLLVDASVRLGSRIDGLDGEKKAAELALFAVMEERVDAVKARLETFIAQITTEPATGGYAPLTEAIIRSSSAIADPNVYVLIVPPPKAYSEQVIVKRRLVAPRLSVSTFIELPYILLKGGRVAWAGTPSSRTGFSVRFA